MKNISTGKLIGFVIFILVVFGAAFFQLAVIDATVGGWLFFAVLLCALVFFRFSKYWQKLLGGGLAGFNKLWIFLLAAGVFAACLLIEELRILFFRLLRIEQATLRLENLIFKRIRTKQPN